MNKRMLALMGKGKEKKDRPKPKRKEERRAKEDREEKPTLAQVSEEEEKKEATHDVPGDHQGNDQRLPRAEQGNQTSPPSNPQRRQGRRQSKELSSPVASDVAGEPNSGVPARTNEYLTLRAYGIELNQKKARRSYLWVVSHCGWCLSDEPLILGEVGRRGGAPKFCSEECAEAQLQYRVVVLGSKANGSKEEEKEEKEESDND